MKPTFPKLSERMQSAADGLLLNCDRPRRDHENDAISLLLEGSKTLALYEEGTRDADG